MKVYDIRGDAPNEMIVDEIHEQCVSGENKYIVIQFDTDVSHVDRVKLVSEIKRFYNIFIILKAPVPDSNTEIEEYFSYGIHGIYFAADLLAYTLEQLDVMAGATDLFLEGCVFVDVPEDLELIVAVLDRKMIPFSCFKEPETVSFIEKHKFFSQISSSLLRYIPYGKNKKLCFSFTDKIKMKVLLETMNFRQKLMIKNIDESFNSSGL